MERWLTTLIAPGTSLGGARPKASFSELDGSLWIGKFPSREDRYDAGAWEFVVHQLAREAKVNVPQARLEKLTNRYGTFCVARFDRSGSRRRMFTSAMTLLERRDGDDGASYLDLAELIATQGAAGHIEEDLAQLFRRVVFNVFVSEPRRPFTQPRLSAHPLWLAARPGLRHEPESREARARVGPR